MMQAGYTGLDAPAKEAYIAPQNGIQRRQLE